MDLVVVDDVRPTRHVRPAIKRTRMIEQATFSQLRMQLGSKGAFSASRPSIRETQQSTLVASNSLRELKRQQEEENQLWLPKV